MINIEETLNFLTTFNYDNTCVPILSCKINYYQRDV